MNGFSTRIPICGHKGFVADKVTDDDNYMLTMAAVVLADNEPEDNEFLDFSFGM
ncbi:hypothetical protein [Candidatus Weimeria sp. HCP3S3_B5]|uniref:hypothetical protein n=1 Tax=Candidatus Weimeria sp. HCP3S3_B5 TaxID=3438871 RepID=UPI003F8A2FE6